MESEIGPWDTHPGDDVAERGKRILSGAKVEEVKGLINSPERNELENETIFQTPFETDQKKESVFMNVEDDPITPFMDITHSKNLMASKQRFS